MENKLIDPKPLKALLVAIKQKALDNERRSAGLTAAVMGAEVRIVDAMLIFINSAMEEKDMTALKLTLESTPVPIRQVKAESEQNAELTDALIELSKQVPEGHALPLNNLGNLKAASVASKIWALRASKKLPEGIVPLLQKGRLYIAHKTPDQVAKMRKSKRVAAQN